MQNFRSILERIWTTVPPSKLRAAVRQRGCDESPFPRSSLQTSFPITLLLSTSTMFPPHVHQPLERRKEGVETAVWERMGNKCLWRSALWWCLCGHTSWTRSGFASPEVGWAIWQCFKPWWDTGLICLHHPEARPGIFKMPSMLMGSLGLCPRGLAVQQRFGRYTFNLCEDLRLNESCHLISGSCITSLENRALDNPLKLHRSIVKSTQGEQFIF